MRVPDEFLLSVGYLCVRRTKEGVDKFDIGGTGFFVSVASQTYPDEIEYHYFVTARHCIERASNFGPLYLRLNTKSGKLAFVEVRGRWIFPDDPAVDLAVLVWGQHPVDFHFRSIPEQAFAEASDVDKLKIGVGDDLVIIGLFTQRYGIARNLPIIRIGTISAMPGEPLQDDGGGHYHTYLAEVRSIGGLSGSPVIVIIDPLRPAARMGGFTGPHPLYLLLGVIRGHWDLKKRGNTEDFIDDDLAQVNMGIAIITPIQELQRVLHNEELTKMRKVNDRDYQKQHMPSQSDEEKK